MGISNNQKGTVDLCSKINAMSVHFPSSNVSNVASQLSCFDHETQNFWDSSQLISGVAKGWSGRAQAHPKVGCTLPMKSQKD